MAFILSASVPKTFSASYYHQSPVYQKNVNNTMKHTQEQLSAAGVNITTLNGKAVHIFKIRLLLVPFCFIPNFRYWTAAVNAAKRNCITKSFNGKNSERDWKPQERFSIAQSSRTSVHITPSNTVEEYDKFVENLKVASFNASVVSLLLCHFLEPYHKVLFSGKVDVLTKVGGKSDKSMLIGWQMPWFLLKCKRSSTGQEHLERFHLQHPWYH